MVNRPLLRIFVLGLLAALLVAVCVPPDALAALPDAGTVVHGAASLAILPLMGLRPMLEADGGAGSGGGTGGGLSRAEVDAIVKGKLGEGATERQIQMVTDLTLRASNAERERDALQAQVKTLADKTPEGSVVLTGDEAKAYTTLKARDGVGETPLKAASEALTQAATDAAELAGLRSSKSLADAVAAEADAGTSLNQLALETYVKGLQTEVADHTGADGKATKRAFAVVEKDGKESRVLLADYLKTEHSALMPALTAAAAGGSGTPAGGGAGGFLPAGASGTPSGTTSTGFDLDAHLAKRNAARTGKPVDTASTGHTARPPSPRP